MQVGRRGVRDVSPGLAGNSCTPARMRQVKDEKQKAVLIDGPKFTVSQPREANLGPRNSGMWFTDSLRVQSPHAKEKWKKKAAEQQF